MPDITMCPGGKCPKKEKCYLYKAIPSPYWQSFFSEPPFEKNRCKFFTKIEKGMRIKD